MRILLSYPSEYDQGEGSHYARVLQRLGHDVQAVNVAASTKKLGTAGRLVRGYPADVWIHDLVEEFGKLDLYLYVEPLGLIPRGLEGAPMPTACVICDTHRSLKPRLMLADLFDHVFLYQRNYVPSFQSHGKSTVHWFPYACDTAVFRDMGIARDLDVAFVGKLHGVGSERRRTIEALQSKYRVNEQRYYLQEEIPLVYSRAKIVLNLPLADDLNFRFFEALSCGALLLTRRVVNGQEELFQEGEHYVAFATDEELQQKVAYYLSHEKERVRIALKGREEVSRKHTLELRLRTLIETVTRGPREGAPVRKFCQNKVLDLYAYTYERMGRVDALLQLAAERRGRPWGRFKTAFKASKTVLRRVVLGW